MAMFSSVQRHDFRLVQAQERIQDLRDAVKDAKATGGPEVLCIFVLGGRGIYGTHMGIYIYIHIIIIYIYTWKYNYLIFREYV
jgi:hypothetical protein